MNLACMLFEFVLMIIWIMPAPSGVMVINATLIGLSTLHGMRRRGDDVVLELEC